MNRKTLFWEDMDKLVQGIPFMERLFIGGYFNGHIGRSIDGYDIAHGGFTYEVRKSGRVSFLNLSLGSDLVIANSYFDKKDGCEDTN